MPTPRSVAPVRGLQSGSLTLSLSLSSTILVKISGGPLRRPPSSLRISLSSALAHGKSSSGLQLPTPCRLSPLPLLWASLAAREERGGRSTLQTDLVGTCQTNERRCPLLAFRNSGNALGLARALGPCTQCPKSRRSGRSRQRSPWFMAIDASVKLPMLTLSILSCLHPVCLSACLAGCLRHAA